MLEGAYLDVKRIIKIVTRPMLFCLPVRSSLKFTVLRRTIICLYTVYLTPWLRCTLVQSQYVRTKGRDSRNVGFHSGPSRTPSKRT